MVFPMTPDIQIKRATLGMCFVCITILLMGCTRAAPDAQLSSSPIVGEWVGVRSFRGWMEDTIEYSRPGTGQAIGPSWALTLRRDGTFVSRWGDGEVQEGTFVLAPDTIGDTWLGQVVLLTSSVGYSIGIGTEFHPTLSHDTLRLHNTWADARDHVFVRLDAEVDRRDGSRSRE